MSNSARPHRQQPTRIPCPWDCPGKNTGVGCISFSNTWRWKVKVKSLSLVLLLATPWTAAHQGSSVHGIFQARVLEGGAIAFSELAIWRSAKVKGLISKTKWSGLIAEICIQLHVRDVTAKSNHTPITSFQMSFTFGAIIGSSFSVSKNFFHLNSAGIKEWKH